MPRTAKAPSVKSPPIVRETTSFDDQVMEVYKNLTNLDRHPFKYTLSVILCCSPNPENIKKFADNNPLDWARLVKIMAELSGYTEKLIIEHHKKEDLASLSDLELEARIRQLSSELHIDGECEEVIGK